MSKYRNTVPEYITERAEVWLDRKLRSGLVGLPTYGGWPRFEYADGRHPGEEIRRLLFINGYSIARAARVLRVNRPNLTNVINGKVDLSNDLASRIAVLLATIIRGLDCVEDQERDDLEDTIAFDLMEMQLAHAWLRDAGVRNNFALDYEHFKDDR
ncbi:hypothetical protein QH494_02625 [Sphingomonas sp. AR_OL41]|uniref:helix-turn-helix transcriptional regulator n=1 Tax=Sphingomonas sp. AR_OL41 TaxID=3042729 RepID=UPI00248183B6|nr:hypothetical protein [Sphingomonas sp. AR_OL41]MDH7971064.1 hypothetical protein [Sphingomonas sp. AR_OL41]